MYCDCEDWKASWPQIEGAQVLSYIHGGRYSGKAFRFCPWCSQELKSTDEPVKVEPISKSSSDKLTLV